MLQIATGKLFKNEIEYRNNLKGVIYTNLFFFREKKIETIAGSLQSTANILNSYAVIYEIKEVIEGDSSGKAGFLISNGLESYILDFSTIMSFTLNCIASPDYSLVNRMLSKQIGVSTHRIPSEFIQQVFDERIILSDVNENFFIEFTNHLIGLKREKYLGVMNSIRTYVTGIHRIADDFELAYTLLVASIESLAQNFDGHQSQWSDYDNEKRKKIDKALDGANELIADKVRNAILSNEHTALSRRFKDFSIRHINPSFYREEVETVHNPISANDLSKALANAYQARSQYIHNLKKLPKLLVMPNDHSETIMIDGKIWLTLQGLSRLARHVIISYVSEQDTIEREEHDYSLEKTNVFNVEFASEHWINLADFNKGQGQKKLKAFLDQLANCHKGNPNATITDLTSLLTQLEKRFDTLVLEDKIAFSSLYILFNFFAGANYFMKNIKAFFNKNYNLYLNKPSSVALITKHLLERIEEWEIEIHHKTLFEYFKENSQRNKLRCPKHFESSMILELAERYRKLENYGEAEMLIAMAVENYPEHSALREIERKFKKERCGIYYREILKKIQNDNV